MKRETLTNEKLEQVAIAWSSMPNWVKEWTIEMMTEEEVSRLITIVDDRIFELQFQIDELAKEKK